MKHRSTFFITFTIGMCVGFFVILYLRYFHLEYGSDLITTRVIPIGVPLISLIAGYFCTISYKDGAVMLLTPPELFPLEFIKMLFSKGILVPPLFFPFGVLVSSMILSIDYPQPMPLNRFRLLLVCCFILYICGIIGALAAASRIFFLIKIRPLTIAWSRRLK